jgi:hypothetical protein
LTAAILSSEQRWQYKLSLDLKIRRSAGVAFQDFFSTVLEKVYGSDFIRIRAMGSLGDKGCDGYRQSCGQVYQCYGKLEDGGVNAATLAKKIADDYALAAGHLTSLMKEWHFAHNLVDGLPVTVLQQIEALKKPGTHIIGLVGPPWLEEQVLALDPKFIGDLLGPAATAQDTRNLQIAEVRDVVDALMKTLDETVDGGATIATVPVDKLAFNKLPNHWVQLISNASQNGPIVRRYFEHHHDVEAGARVAAEFSTRYKALKLQGLTPGFIMDQLYEQLTGIGVATAARQVAAHSLLAYLFDACDIFEDHPSKVTA